MRRRRPGRRRVGGGAGDRGAERVGVAMLAAHCDARVVRTGKVLTTGSEPGAIGTSIRSVG